MLDVLSKVRKQVQYSQRWNCFHYVPKRRGQRTTVRPATKLKPHDKLSDEQAFWGSVEGQHEWVARVHHSSEKGSLSKVLLYPQAAWLRTYEGYQQRQDGNGIYLG